MAGITVSNNLYRAIPMAWPWVAGRFYDAYPNVTGYSTGAIASATHCEPFIIPNPIALTSVNVEVVTTAATAGTLARFALYRSDYNGWPDNLVADWGTVAVDATGLRTISISTYIDAPGLYWVGFAQQTAAQNATYRTNGTTVIHAMSRDSIYNFAVGGGNTMALGTSNTIATVGFPSQFWHVGDNATAFNFANAANPRILLGV